MKKIFLLFTIVVFTIVSCKKEQEGVVLANVNSFEKGLQNDDIQLIDVRTPEEYNEGHIENAVNINISADDFDSKIQALDKEKPVYVYCKSGGRSARAAAVFKTSGFNSITDLDGGIGAWKENDRKVVK